MTQFVQLHLLISYPPANPNRDDAGKPKTAVMGGANRLRISSQSLKRAWRTSEIFTKASGGLVGKRTRSIAEHVVKELGNAIAPELASRIGATIHDVFTKKEKDLFKPAKKGKKNGADDAKEAESGAEDSEESVAEGQAVHLGAEEMKAIYALISWVKENKSEPSVEQFLALRKEKQKSVDIAMFGRMLANATSMNVEAAVQVANALTVHQVTVEDDFFTAVDDLNNNGAAYMDETAFAAGLFYLYLCVDTDLLLANLCGDKALAGEAIGALIETAAKIAPSGMQNRFGNRVRASYLRAERGSQQPRSLSVAFLKPVTGNDMLAGAVKAIEKTAENMDKVYGNCVDEHRRMLADNDTAEGSLADLKTFVTGVYCD